MTKIITKEIPHIYRNRFLRDNGGSAIISNSGSGGGNTTVYPFEPHYLWGQYFDDTQDISGDLSNVGNISASGVVTASAATFADFVNAHSISGASISGSNAIITNLSASTATTNTISGDSATFNTVSGTSISGNDGVFTNSIKSPSISGTNATIANKLTTNQLEAVSGYIQTLLSEDITVDNLTVTKAAHFFKLIVDEIKSTQGQVIITPANAVIDKVETVNGNYRCYYRAKDADGKEIISNFEPYDQVVCQTFNAASGVSYNVSNTYYWRLCVGTGTTSTTIGGEAVDCHYIDLSDSDKDTYSNSAPKAGDNIVLLGNRSVSGRQAAIIISAYNTQFLDKNIKAPSIVQYYGINDYNLESHRRNVISRDFNEFKGTFKTSTGDDIEELIEDVTSGITAYLHTAWANSADGSVDFTKNPSGGSYAYVGFCTNNTESDSSLTYSDYDWSYIKGADGSDGTDGNDGVSITSVTEYYLISSSSTNVTTATTGWQTTFIAPTPEKKYLWNYEENNFSDGTTAKTIPVIIGNYAKDGTNGTNGEDGRGISSITEYYLASSASGNVTTATTGWSTTIQKMTPTNKYLWNYELITYTDNTTANTEPVIIGAYGDKGDSGTSVTVTATSITYAVTTSSTQPSDSEFVYNSVPSLSTGDYLWCKTIVSYSNGTTTKSYSVSRIGADGEDGTNGTNGVDGKDSYLHIAYALSSDGSSGFSTTYFNGALYIGTCTNSTQSDPQTYTSYTWARLKGEKGDSGNSITISSTSITYAVTTENTQPADSAFTATTVPTVPKGSYLWTKTVVTYSDGTVTKTYTVSYEGNDGNDGNDGEDAEFYKLVPIKEQAVVDGDGNLGVNVQYQIAHVSGANVTVITATTSGYHVLIVPDNATQSNPYSLLSTGTTTPSYTNTTYQTDYHHQGSQTTSFRTYLVYGSSHTPIKGESSYIQVVFEAAATLEITDEINATVQGHSASISANTNSISTLNIAYSGLTSTVSAITNGDTKNMFYPSCYNSDGMSDENNIWLATNILNGNVMCSGWTCDNQTKYGKPIINSSTSILITGSTGEVYLYSPYLSLSSTYYYSLTFSGNCWNYGYIELCKYSNKTNALNPTQNITSTQLVTSLGYNENNYTYNSSIFTFKPSSSGSYYRIRFRLTYESSPSPYITLTNVSLYRGTTSSGVSAGSFATWNNAISKASSVISQTADKISLGLDRAGIDLTSGKITSVADNFEWLNNDGETVLGLDSGGNATFNGTVRAKNLYKTVALASNNGYTVVLTPEGTVKVWVYINTTFYCEENQKTYIAGQYYEITTTELGEMYYYPSDAGYFNVITGPADEVIVVNGPTTANTYTVYLPKSSDYVGKAVTVRHAIVENKTVTVKQCDEDIDAFSTDGITLRDPYSDHNIQIDYGTHQDDDVTISYGQAVTFYSVGLYWIKLETTNLL